MQKYSVAILGNEIQDDHNLWVQACLEYNEELEFSEINLTSDSWLQDIQLKSFDYFLARPPGISETFKQLYDERVYIIERILKKPVYPNFTEVQIYENKRFLSFWLKANNIPHPNTHVFYNKREAEDFVLQANFPLVAKENIGASGSGVVILRSANDARGYIERTFHGKGAPKRWGPNLQKSNLLKRGLQYVFKPKLIAPKLSLYKMKRNERQKSFVLLQEFVPHDFEWRVVRIGNSFFAHKKLKINDKASGSTLKGYENPPLKLLDFVRDITDEYELFSQAIDVFVTQNGEYLVNEMQCIFGQSDQYQMLVDDKPGRYIQQKGSWVFQEGNFNENESFNLRILWILEQLNQRE